MNQQHAYYTSFLRIFFLDIVDTKSYLKSIRPIIVSCFWWALLCSVRHVVMRYIGLKILTLFRVFLAILGDAAYIENVSMALE